MNMKNYQQKYKIETVNTPLFQPHSEKYTDEVPEYEPIVVSTYSMSRLEWRRTYKFAIFVQAFHVLGLLQVLAIILRHEYRITYSDFFESLFGSGFVQTESPRFSHAGFESKGADQHASFSIHLKDAFHGAIKTICLNNGRNLEVKIPKGITSGKRIRLTGQGSAGMGGKSKGCLLYTSPSPRDATLSRMPSCA